MIAHFLLQFIENENLLLERNARKLAKNGLFAVTVQELTEKLAERLHQFL